MKASEVIIKARSLIEAGWTQGASARDKHGARKNIRDDNATHFCALGAVNRVLYKVEMTEEEWVKLRHRVVQHLGNAMNAKRDELGSGIVTWNDRSDTTKEDVLHAFSVALDQADHQTEV